MSDDVDLGMFVITSYSIHYTKLYDINPILLRKDDDHILIKKQFDVVKEYLESKKVPYLEIFTPKGNLLNALINPMYYMGYATILRAIRDGVDPTDIPAIRFIKARL